MHVGIRELKAKLSEYLGRVTPSPGADETNGSPDHLEPNHHAHYRHFGGLFGYVAGLTMIVGRGRDARLVADLATVGPDDVVLDIGCGPGTAARHAAGRGAKVIGLDPSAPMLRLAELISRLRATDGELDWRQGSAETMELPPGSVSVCWSIASSHHDVGRRRVVVVSAVWPGSGLDG